MKKFLIVCVALAAALTASPSFARQKYWINVGCWPDYRMHHIACNVGETRIHCARMACYGVDFGLAVGPGVDKKKLEEAKKNEPKISTPGSVTSTNGPASAPK